MISTFQHSVAEIRQALAEPHAQSKHRLEDIEALLSAASDVGSVNLYEQLQRYAGMMVQNELMTLALHYLDAVDQNFVELHGKITHASEVLTQMAAANPTPRTAHADDEDDFVLVFENALIGDVLSKATRMVTSLDQCLQDGFIARVGTFWKVIDAEDQRSLRSFEQAIRHAIDHIVRDALSECDIDELLRSVRLDELELVDWMRPYFEKSAPYILDCGGEVRLFLTVPCMSSGGLCANALEEIFSESPTVVPATRGGIQVCHEVQAIPIANVALRIIEDVPEAAAERRSTGIPQRRGMGTAHGNRIELRLARTKIVQAHILIT